jgi:hypothetical protein
MRLPILFSLAVCTACAHPSQLRSTNSSPETARIVTDDIPRFWAAFEKMTSASDTLHLRIESISQSADILQNGDFAKFLSASGYGAGL